MSEGTSSSEEKLNNGHKLDSKDEHSSVTSHTMKQGSYGKVKIHSESKLSQLMHFDEVIAAFTLLYMNPLKSNLDTPYIQYRYSESELKFCNDILINVSRSFASVIQQLPEKLLVDVVVFYLVLRALDTIEDDMEAFDNSTKIEKLLNFHENLGKVGWNMDGVGQGHERKLLQNFNNVCIIYNQLPQPSQEIIHDITRRMASGMAEFVEKDLGQGTQNIDEYNMYCHYVAGLVGEGLSRLFASSGLERPEVGAALKLANQMGLFLQKTNIIRDFLEDYVEKRAFWPQSVWKQYSKTGELGYFTNPGNDPSIRQHCLQCLNALICDALELVPDCLEYMSMLRNDAIFRFCAIPQVMAIATLEKCYNNYDVFTGVVKIRKGLSCKLILQTTTLADLHETFNDFAESIRQRASKLYDDPNSDRTVKVCESICQATKLKPGEYAARHCTKSVTKSARVVMLVTWAILSLLGTLGVMIPSLSNATNTSWIDKILLVIISGIISCVLADVGKWGSSKESTTTATVTAMITTVAVFCLVGVMGTYEISIADKFILVLMSGIVYCVMVDVFNGSPPPDIATVLQSDRSLDAKKMD